MGFSLISLPKGTHLLNNSVSSPTSTNYTPSTRISGTGLIYTSQLAQQSINYVPVSSGNTGGSVPSMPKDPECDPEEYLNQKNKMFENLLKYMDEYTTYNYLKVTNPYFGNSFLALEQRFDLEVNMVTSIEKLFYFRLFPEDNEICEDKLELVRAKVAVKDFSLNLEVCGCHS